MLQSATHCVGLSFWSPENPVGILFCYLAIGSLFAVPMSYNMYLIIPWWWYGSLKGRKLEG